MEKQFKKIIVTTLSLLRIGLVTELAQASTLVMGKDNAIASQNLFKISDYTLAPDSVFFQASSGEMPTSLKTLMATTGSQSNLNQITKAQGKKDDPQSKILTEKALNKTNKNPNTQAIALEKPSLQTPNYSENLLSQLDNIQLVEVDLATQQTLTFIPTAGLLETTPQQSNKAIRFPRALLVAILLLLGWRGYYILKAFGKSGDGGIVESLKDKYSNPKVPENAQNLHNRNFKQLMSLGQKVEKIAEEKFGSQNFIAFLKIRHNLTKGGKEYQGINQSIQYLEVAIATQSSFLKLEQTESRYRSRKQQEFYNFVAETVAQDLDKEVFRNTLKRKLAEIVPLLNSEEGRTALQSYIKEITKISEHSLGLKLFSLFKQHKVTNFTILAKVADIVSKIQSEDLSRRDNLIVIVLESYEVFENLAPIIDLEQERVSPETFAIILQYIGLSHKQSSAMDDFANLSQSLKQWHKPYKSLMTIRQQYPKSEYRLPREFSEDIPGLQIFKKYEKYVFDD